MLNIGVLRYLFLAPTSCSNVSKVHKVHKQVQVCDQMLLDLPLLLPAKSCIMYNPGLSADVVKPNDFNHCLCQLTGRYFKVCHDDKIPHEATLTPALNNKHYSLLWKFSSPRIQADVSKDGVSLMQAKQPTACVSRALSDKRQNYNKWNSSDHRVGSEKIASAHVWS